MAIKFDPNLILPGEQPKVRSGQTLIDNLSQDFNRVFNEVNELQNQADLKIEEFATSKDKDIHGTMVAMQKADVSLRLLLQVRSKLTQAYQEIIRMQL